MERVPPKSWGWGRPRGGCAKGTNSRKPFCMKGDEYSLSEMRFQREQVESSWSSGVPQPHAIGQGSFLFYLVLLRMVIVPEAWFLPCWWAYNVFGGEIKVNFSSMLEAASFGWSVIYTFTPYPMKTACTKCVDYKPASDQSPPPPSQLMAGYLPTMTVPSTESCHFLSKTSCIQPSCSDASAIHIHRYSC